MSDTQKRLHTLLTDRAIEGLDPRSEQELDLLLGDTPIDPSYEQAAAGIELALLPHDEPLPDRLTSKLFEQAEQYWGFAQARPGESTAARQRSARSARPEPAPPQDTQHGYLPADLREEIELAGGPAHWTGPQPALNVPVVDDRTNQEPSKAKRKREPEPEPDDESGEFTSQTSATNHTGVIDRQDRAGGRFARLSAYVSALAALVVLGIAIYLLWKSRSEGEVDPAALQAQVEQANDHVQWELAATPEDPAVGEGAGGSVLWSSELQAGVMKLQGLAVNDPTEAQYQLWIIDETREGPPVDGGVFNVTTDGQELVIPIDAKLLVGKPKAFAITVERPGGVVVSAQERVVMVAAPPG